LSNIYVIYKIFWFYCYYFESAGRFDLTSPASALLIVSAEQKATLAAKDEFARKKRQRLA
jgi:hypothetical protein